MSGNRKEARRRTATHHLDGFYDGMSGESNGGQKAHGETHDLDAISEHHVRKSKRRQEAHNYSPSGWDFMAACQRLKRRLGGAGRLTLWMRFHGGMSGSQSCPGDARRLTGWMGF